MTQRVDKLPGAKARIDTCWNHIGTRGDGSCPELSHHLRCPNCPVFEQAAAKLLDIAPDHGNLNDDTPLSKLERSARLVNHGPAPTLVRDVSDTITCSALVFRIANEWLAMSTSSVLSIDDIRPVHSLPHRRDRTVLGLVNVHGTLTVAVSLSELLDLDHATAGKRSSRNSYARLLVAAHRGAALAFPVDEVEGVIRFPESAVLAIPATLAHTTAAHVRGVLAWRDTTVGVLDSDRVFDALSRSLR